MREFVKMSRTLKILYVEDNEEARSQTLKLLNNFFNDIDIAEDGREGLHRYVEYFDKHNMYYDIVISDINMPKMNGIEMCLQMLELNKDQPVLVISAHNESEKLQQLIDIGITQYLHKPIDNQIFLKKIGKIVDYIFEKKEEEKRLREIEKLNRELDSLVDSFDTYVIASRTDLKGVITYASKAYENISGYTKEELIGKPHNIVRHPDMPKSAFKDMWNTIKQERLWVGEVKNLKKDKSFYWVKAFIAPYYDKDRKHVGYSAIRLDITAQKKVEELHNQVNTLLDNAGEGFLSFDKNLKCESSFSKECIEIFDTENIEGMDISELLFSSNEKDKQLFKDGIEKIIDCDDRLSKDLLLSLLPKEQRVKEKIIEIKYKIIDSDRFMMILDDITKTKELEKKIEQQRQIQKMIVSIVSNQNEFIELKLDFENFLSNPPANRDTLLRKLHTFKGIFAQKDMLYTPEGIHKLETKLNNTQEDLSTVFTNFDLQTVFEKDLSIIKKTLGKEFLKTENFIKVDKKQLNDIESEIKNLNIDDSQKEKVDEILTKLHKLRYETLDSMLGKYPLHVKKVADKLEKLIYPMEIAGDKELMLPPRYKPFMDSLIHLFNNSIDHGIESIETRVEKQKDEIGTITCKYRKKADALIIEIEDDGAGIDIEKLTSKAIKKGLIDKQQSTLMSEEEKLNLMFADSLSTKNYASITSGRGVGMSVIKEELKKLDGSLKIKNRIGYGVKFKFTLPIKEV